MRYDVLIFDTADPVYINVWFTFVLWILLLKYCYCFVIRKLYITIDAQDENFLPSHIVVMGGEIDNLEKLNDVNIDT